MKQSFSPNTDMLCIDLEPISSHLVSCTISVDPKISSPIRDQTLEVYREHVLANGLEETPTAYVEHHYKEKIEADVKKLVLRYLVMSYLRNICIAQSLPVAGHPRLKKITIDDKNKINYTFDLSFADRLAIREWKHFLFRAPKRKNYKDLDKQVETFLKRAQENTRKNATKSIQENDWVYITAQLVDKMGKPVTPGQKQGFWVKIKTTTISHPLYALLKNRSEGDTFITNKLFLDGFYETSIGDQQYFRVTIDAIAKGDYFLLDLFKSTFRLANKADVHEKLIEIFSYRNDMSQRRAIIEEMFHLLFSKHRFEVPKHLVLRKQEEILESMKRRPDFHAYRCSKDFLLQVEMLAEKLLKEEIIIDQIANTENIEVDIKDQQQYLNLLSDHRLKEFIYFRGAFDIDETASPIHQSLLEEVCRREKTLNYILYHLMH